MKRLVFVALVSILLAGCGDGGGSGGPEPPPPPPEPPPLVCGENEIKVDETCICKEGFERDADGKCVPEVIIPPDVIVLRLTWDPVVHPDLTGYKMYRTTIWCEYEEENVLSYLSNNTQEYSMSYSFDPSAVKLFEHGETYYFTIKAYAIYDFCEGLPADCTAPMEIEESDFSNQVYCMFDEDILKCVGTNPDPEEFCE